MSLKTQGFVEQASAQPDGLKIAGWAVHGETASAPHSFIVSWGDQVQRIAPSRVREDVGRVLKVPAGKFGFDAVLPVEVNAETDWPSLQVKAVWGKEELELPFLKVATEGFTYAQQQFTYVQGLQRGGAQQDEGGQTLTKTEADKYREMYRHAGYKANPGAPHEARDYLDRWGLKPGDSIIDFGSGPGFASNYFHEQGLRVIAIDIAPNAMRDEFLGRFPLIVSAFWDLPAKLDADWGFCTDVMEHIPPDRLDEVLGVISSSVRNAVLFNISLRFDGCGAVINQILHLSVHSRQWWEAKLLQFWSKCEFVRGKEGDYACWIVSGRRS